MCLSPSLRIRIFPNAFNSLVHSLPSPTSCCAPTVQNLSSILKSLFSSSTFLKFSTFFIDSLGILPHAPQFHSPPSVPSPMQHHLKEILKNKKKIRQTRILFIPPSVPTLRHLFIHPGGLRSHCVSCSTPFVQLTLLVKFMVMSH